MKKIKKEKLGSAKERFSLKKQFFDALSYVKESRNYIFFVLAVFVFSALAAFIYPENFVFFDELLKNLLDKTEGLEGFSLMSFIFTNNTSSAFLGLFNFFLIFQALSLNNILMIIALMIAVPIGFFLGITPVLFSMINGAVLGYVFAKVYALSGPGDFWRILPHGIFELPAIFIALGLGVKLGFFVFSKNMKQEFLRRFYYSFLVFLLIVVPLLVIAAIIEGLLITMMG